MYDAARYLVYMSLFVVPAELCVTMEGIPVCTTVIHTAVESKD